MVILKRFSRVDFGLVRRRHLCIYHSHVVMRMVGVLYNGVSEGSICIYIYIYIHFLLQVLWMGSSELFQPYHAAVQKAHRHG